MIKKIWNTFVFEDWLILILVIIAASTIAYDLLHNAAIALDIIKGMVLGALIGLFGGATMLKTIQRYKKLVDDLFIQIEARDQLLGELEEQNEEK